MKGFGKFVTFVGVAGAALAGLWYFCEVNKEKCEACADTEGADGEAVTKKNERSYVSLDPELKESAKRVAKEVKSEVGKAAEEIKETAVEGKDTLKKAVKSAAQDIMAKAEDAAKGVGLVKDDKKTTDFEFEDFDKASEKVKDAVDEAASKIDIQ